MAPLSVTLDWADLAVGSTAILGVAAIVGGIVRFGLIPYLRSELIVPAQETNRELIGGDHDPSIRDQLDKLVEGQAQHSGEIEDATLELRAMALMFDGHLDWAQREVDKLRRERQEMVDELWIELNRQRAAGLRPDPRHRKGLTDEDT